MSPAVTVRVAEDPADREACFAVRKEVFVAEQGVPPEIEYDAYDEGAVHVLAVREDGLPLGTGRLLHGADAALVRAVEDAARERGLTGVDLHAQTHALGFYERLGYQAYGPEFPDAGMPHRAMRRAL